ncbi:hypothetical protein CYG48_18495 (plasmid) [Neorhizobium sp. SOG26]|uniref:hypothetical protein n=1 Tax=Neorhizobium sp. SOG26 TaxID=2060726 RepID=UPI000E596564|nr:hypothetical protein [Neorhizobium sp. SOG26]AXV17792.1 hypothetical protein CYG48_18495 [Neorhizobium sp. SOG26]
MLSEIAAWLFALFVVDPIYEEVRERLEAANLSTQVFQQSQQCLSTHGPRLLTQAGEDPVWAIGTAVGIATGSISPQQLLNINDRHCSVVSGLLANQRRESAES